MSNEKLLGKDYMFGIELEGLKYPLTLDFMDKMNKEVCELLFGAGSDRLIKLHSFRKGGASSYYAAKISDFDVKLINESVGISLHYMN